MGNKSIYIGNEDEPMFQAALAASGLGLSTLVVASVREYTNRRKTLPQGFDRLAIIVSEQGQPTKRVFTGRWIIPPEAPFRHVEIEKRVNRSEYASTDLIEEKTVTLYSVAFTQKGNWMVQQWLEHQSPIDGGAVVYASLSDMNSKLPRALVATVADKADGTSEQEWDI